MTKHSLPLFLILIAGFFIVTLGQTGDQARIDSLKHELAITHDDTLRVRLIKKICDAYELSFPDSAMVYANRGLQEAIRMQWKKGIGFFHNEKGILLSDKGDYPHAIEQLQEALAIHQAGSDQANMARTLNQLGAAYQRQSNLTRATDYFFQSLKLAESLGDSNLLVTCYDNLSDVYMGENNFDKALEYANKALAHTDSINNPNGKASVLEGLANIYIQKGNIPQSRDHYFRALALYTRAGNRTGIAEVYTNLSVTDGSDYRTKIEDALKAKKIWDETNPLFMTAIMNTGNLGADYLDLVRYDSLHIVKPGGVIPAGSGAQLKAAMGYLQKAIAMSRQVGDRNYESYFTGVLAEAQAQGGDYKDAYKNFRKYQDVQDSIFSQDNKNRIASLEGQHEIALRDQQLQISRLELASQRKQTWILIGGLFALALIGGLLYWQSRTRRRANRALIKLNTELDEANRTKATIFAILGHDLRRPVASLLNFLHLQRKAPDLLDTAATASHQQRIIHSAEGLLETMEGLLLWSKSQLDEFHVRMQNVALNPIIEQCIRLQQPDEIPDGKTAIDAVINDINPAVLVFTDPDILATIIRNLLQNALKASPAGRKIMIAWENGRHILSIANEGKSFSQEQYERLLSGEGSGLDGLGLRLVHELSQKIKVVVRFVKTDGARVEIILPMA